MAERVIITVPASDKLSASWRAMQDSLDMAARRFTGKETFPISPDYAYDLEGAPAEVSRVLADARKKTPADIHHQFAHETIKHCDDRVEKIVHHMWYIAH
jgi:hypothetical protein